MQVVKHLYLKPMIFAIITHFLTTYNLDGPALEERYQDAFIEKAPTNTLISNNEIIYIYAAGGDIDFRVTDSETIYTKARSIKSTFTVKEVLNGYIITDQNGKETVIQCNDLKEKQLVFSKLRR